VFKGLRDDLAAREHPATAAGRLGAQGKVGRASNRLSSEVRAHLPHPLICVDVGSPNTESLPSFSKIAARILVMLAKHWQFGNGFRSRELVNQSRRSVRQRRMTRYRRGFAFLAASALCVGTLLVGLNAISDPLPPDTTYRPLPTRPLSEVKADDEAQKPAVMSRQSDLLNRRYDLADRSMPGVMMSGGRKAVQAGVRVKLPPGATWEALAEISPAEIRERGLLPAGFLPLPHVKHATGGQVFPDRQIDEIRRQEARELRRFDVNFDLPEHLTPEFPPPLFLTTQPHLGDVSRGRLLTIKNFYELMNGIITPVQMEGLRLLLTPFPQKSSIRPKTARLRIKALASPASTVTPIFTPMAHFISRPMFARNRPASGSIPPACVACSISGSMARSARFDRWRTSRSSSSGRRISMATM
jgi:hypothetical protein